MLIKQAIMIKKKIYIYIYIYNQAKYTDKKKYNQGKLLELQVKFWLYWTHLLAWDDFLLFNLILFIIHYNNK